MLKYMAEHHWKYKIIAVEVEKETESSVWIDGRRRQKITQSETVHDTWEEAHAHLTAIAEGKVEHHRKALERAAAIAANIKSMKRSATQST